MDKPTHKPAPPTKSDNDDFYFPTRCKDMNRIRERCPDTAATRFMAWSVLNREAHFIKLRRIRSGETDVKKLRKITFVMADFILADRCGLHVRSIDAIKNDLAGVGLLKFQSKRVKGRHTPTEYTLKASPSATNTDGSPSVVDGGVSVADTLTPSFGVPQDPQKNESKTKKKNSFFRDNAVGLGAHGFAKEFSSREGEEAKPEAADIRNFFDGVDS